MFFEPFNLAISGASLICSLVIQLLTGDFAGKLDVAPAYVHISVIEHSHVIKKLDMPAFRAQCDINYRSGLFLRPNFLYTKYEGRFWSAGVLGGFGIPIFRVKISALGGVNFLGLKTKVDLPACLDADVREGFRSVTSLAGGEIAVMLTPCLKLTGQYLYGWARTHTALKDLLKTKAHSSGSIYCGIIEYNFPSGIAVNAAVSSDQSLSKEKHGLRIFGVKTGVAFRF